MKKHILKLINRIFKRNELKPYSHVTKWKCDCDKIFDVYHNQYGTCSGGGSCECGARLIIN